MKDEFLCALQFLTRVPVSSGDGFSPPTLGRSVLFYPIVGLVVGGALYLLHLLMGGMDSGLQAALILVAWVLITGALHIDGLADLVDAWVGAHGDKDRMMALMKDPTSGPMAVTAVVLLLLVKYAALAELLESEFAIALVVAPFVGRTGLLAALRFYPYVRPEGLGAVLAEHMPAPLANRVLCASAAFVVLLLGWHGVVIALVSGVCFYFLGNAIKAALGGITGDCAGAICELLEAVVLVSLVALL